MNIDAILSTLRGCELRQGTSDEEIERVEKTVGRRLPTEYRNFMRRSNGAEGTLPNGKYLMLWPIDQLAELNAGYCVSEFAPGLFLFGSNGGGEAYAFDTRDEPMRIVELPFIPMSHEESTEMGTSFEAFVRVLADKEGKGSA